VTPVPIEVKCDRCQVTYLADDADGGKTGRCKCGNRVVIPAQVALGRALREAFSLVNRHPGLTVGSVALTVFYAIVLSTGAASVVGLGTQAAKAAGALDWSVSAGEYLARLLVELCLLPLLLGPLYVMDELLVRGRSELGAANRGYSSFGAIAGVGLVIGLPAEVLSQALVWAAKHPEQVPLDATIGAGIAATVAQTWLGLCLMFAYIEIVDRRAGTSQALAASWAITAGRRVALLPLLLLPVLGGAALLGGLIGALYVAFPPGFHDPWVALALLSVAGTVGLAILAVAYAAQLIVYRDLRGLEGASAQSPQVAASGVPVRPTAPPPPPPPSR
jgi:hypothetical protein